MALARIIPWAVALGSSLVIPSAAYETAPTTGRSIATLANVTVKSRNGARIPLGSRVRSGKPTLISLWASWCFPCVAEAPYLDKIRKDLGSGYTFLYINRSDGDPDPDQPPAAVTQFLAHGGLSDVDYVVADLKAYRQILGADVSHIPEGKVGVPRVYLFDRDGRQIYTAYGFQDADGPELENRVRGAMAKSTLRPVQGDGRKKVRALHETVG